MEEEMEGMEAEMEEWSEEEMEEEIEEEMEGIVVEMELKSEEETAEEIEECREEWSKAIMRELGMKEWSEEEMEEEIEEEMEGIVLEMDLKAVEETAEEIEEWREEWRERKMGEGMEREWTEEGREEGMEGEWREGWREGWLEGWWEGFRKGGREAGLEAEMQGGMEGDGMERGWRGGWMEGRTEGWRQGWLEAGTEGGMEVGMLNGGMGKGWREGWREGWKDGWRRRWRQRKDSKTDWARDDERDGGMEWKEGWRLGWREGSTKGWLQGGLVGVMEGEMEEWKDLEFDIDKLETEMEVILFIKEKIYHPAFESFLLKVRYNKSNFNPLATIKKNLKEVEKILPTTAFTMKLEIEKQVVFDDLVSLASSVVDFMGEITSSSQKQFPSYLSYHFRKEWFNIRRCFRKIHETCTRWVKEGKALVHIRESRRQFIAKVIDVVRNPPIDLNILPKLLLTEAPQHLDAVGRSLNLPAQVLLIIKAFPSLGELKESSEMLNLLEVIDQVAEEIREICYLCRGCYPAVLLVGSLLSFKRSNNDTWYRVQKDIRVVIYLDGRRCNYTEFFRRIFTYCFDDLPKFLQECFLYMACYPIGYEIPATSLTKIWIAEGFVTPENGETPEETAQKYLEQFVQRSLVWVSRRFYSGTIKYFQVPRFIHELVIEKLSREFLVVNPDKETMKSRINRVAIHHVDNNQCAEVKIKPVRSFLAFDLDRDVLERAMYLRVLELRNSTIKETYLSKLDNLQYLGLRGSSIHMLPENIGNMKCLKTLDVRDTDIKILPESIWNISSLRHVHVNPKPQIEGPPPTANLSNLQILKTVVVPESWLQTFPHSLINLRKLALSNMDNPACKPNPYWISISNLLSQVVNLVSMTIIGNIVPAEFVDTRAFSNLETVKSIKFEGKWSYWKLPIDNVKFPPNLTKLTLSKSGLKEDPMLRLGMLPALKYLSLKNGVYMGEKMVCSANGFPQLQFLELSELNNLEIWEADPMAMPQLTKLRVVKCCKLEKLPDLEHVTDKDIS